MSKSDPNFLVRWLDRNPMSPLTRARFFLDVPAFNFPNNWLGYSDIIAAYSFISPNNFVLKDFDTWIPLAPNYTLCIAYANADNSVVRYRFWTAVGEQIFSTLPLYSGQLIKKLFRFEIWNTSQGTAVNLADLTPILTSVLQNIDYRYTTDMPLALPTLVTNFGSGSPAGGAPLLLEGSGNKFLLESGAPLLLEGTVPNIPLPIVFPVGSSLSPNPVVVC